MSIVLHYDLIGAYNAGVKDHPQTDMSKLGYTVLAAVPEVIGDCWFFEVENIIEPLPSYLSKSNYKIEKDPFRKSKLTITQIRYAFAVMGIAEAKEQFRAGKAYFVYGIGEEPVGFSRMVPVPPALSDVRVTLDL